MADNDNAQPSQQDDPEAPAKGGNFLERLKKAPPWVWIGLAIAAATLIIGYIALRNQSGSSTTPGTPGTPGASQPGTPGATQGSNGSGPYATQGEINSIDSRIQQLQQEIQNHHSGGGKGGGKGGHHKILQGSYQGPVYSVGG